MTLVDGGSVRYSDKRESVSLCTGGGALNFEGGDFRTQEVDNYVGVRLRTGSIGRLGSEIYCWDCRSERTQGRQLGFPKPSLTDGMTGFLTGQLMGS